MPDPGENIYTWATLASDNAGADPLINWAEGMPRADVNNSARSMMAAQAKQRNLLNGSIVTTGTANAQLFQSGFGYTTGAPPVGMRVLLKIGTGLTNTGAATLSMDSLAAAVIKDIYGADLLGGEVIADTYSQYLYDGTNWILLRETGGLVLLGKQTASMTQYVDFPIGSNDAYDEYSVIISRVLPQTDTDTLGLRISTDNGVSFHQVATDYVYNRHAIAGEPGTGLGSDGTAGGRNDYLPLTGTLSSNVGCPVGGEVRFFAPFGGQYNQIMWSTCYFDLRYQMRCDGSGFYAAGTPTTNIRFQCFGGNISTGQFSVYGVKK